MMFLSYTNVVLFFAEPYSARIRKAYVHIELIYK